MDEQDILAWYDQVAEDVTSTQKVIAEYSIIKKEIASLSEQQTKNKEDLKQAEHKLQIQLQRPITPEVKNHLADLSKEVKLYSERDSFLEVYDFALHEWMTGKQLSNTKGTYRFQLCAQLLFCIYY